MYHDVERRDRLSDTISKKGLHPSYIVSTDIFSDHLTIARNSGIITLLVEDLDTCASPIDNSYIALTFDDGYDNNYHIVFPELLHHGMCATFF